jgi:hypothetical protein
MISTGIRGPAMQERFEYKTTNPWDNEPPYWAKNGGIFGWVDVIWAREVGMTVLSLYIETKVLALMGMPAYCKYERAGLGSGLCVLLGVYTTYARVNVNKYIHTRIYTNV